MKDCNKDIQKFHDKHVRLDADMREELSKKAGANEIRIKDGLKKNKEPQPLYFALQGSHAMRTGVQHPKNDYDIDNGIIFLRADLKGAQGADKSALDARQMVCDALQEDPLGNFSREPEVRPNCVRVYYVAGYHVDVPVYRIEDPDSESLIYELASAQGWKTSSPQGVTDWFNGQVKDKRHTSEKEGTSQFRRMVRLLKKFSISRAEKLPSGFILTVLASEKYVFYTRDDEAFYYLLCSVSDRLNDSLTVSHPVLPGENITKGDSDPKMRLLRDRVKEAIDDLAVLFEPDDVCTRKAAFKAWKSVFRHEFFDELIEAASVKSFSIVEKEPTSPVQKDGPNQFG